MKKSTKIRYIPFGQSLCDLAPCFDRFCDFHAIIQACITTDILCGGGKLQTPAAARLGAPTQNR